MIIRFHERWLAFMWLIAIVSGCRHPVQICGLQNGICALLNTSEVACWGNNPPGLGAALTAVGNKPTEVANETLLVPLDNPLAIYCGLRHVCAQLGDGTLRCFGLSSNGRLGTGTSMTNVGSAPNQMGTNLTAFRCGNTTSDPIVDVFVGPVQTCVRLQSNVVRCAGANSFGLLMVNSNSSDIGTNNSTLDENMPTVTLADSSPIRKAWFSSVASCWLLNNDRLFCAGNNAHGQLGHVNRTLGENASTHVDLGPNQTVVDLCMGNLHTCVIRQNGTRSVICFGNGANGQLGLGSTSSYFLLGNQTGQEWRPVSLGTDAVPERIFCSDTQTCVLFQTGQAKCWGTNTLGRFGYGTIVPMYGHSPETTGTGIPFVRVNNKTITSIALSTANCFLLNSTEMVCFGRGAEGQLMTGDSGARGFTTHQVNDGILYARLNACEPPELPEPNVSVAVLSSASTPVLQDCSLPEDDVVMELNERTSTGVCARTRKGKLKCWGSNIQGLLLQNGSNLVIGDQTDEMGSALPVPQIGTEVPVRLLAGSLQFTCAVFDNNLMKCWGNNADGNLLLGHSVSHGATTQTIGPMLPYVNLLGNWSQNTTIMGLSRTWGNFMCAWFLDGQAKCWGLCNTHQCGYDNGRVTWGNNISEVGDALPFHRFGNQSAVFMEGGLFHVCTILASRDLVCWGRNTAGATGYGSANWTLSSTGFPYTDQKVPIPGGRKVADMCTMSEATCVLTVEDSLVYCWGSNSHGQVGRGTPTTPLFDIGPPVNLGASAGRVVDLSCGHSYVCATFQSGKLKCWGSVPGLGGTNLALTTVRGIAPSQMGERLEYLDLGTNQRVRKVYAYATHVCAVLETWALKCWGLSNNGALGAGAVNSFGVFETESMGNNLPAVALGLTTTTSNCADQANPEQTDPERQNEQSVLSVVILSTAVVALIGIATLIL